MSNVPFDPNTPIDFGAAAAYEPWSGLQKDHLTHDGDFVFRIVEYRYGRAEGANGQPGNVKVDIVVECIDEDNKGRRTFQTLPVTGVDKNNKPNILRLIDFIAKARQLNVEQARGLAGLGNRSVKEVLDTYAPAGTTQIGATCETDEYKGAKQSQITFFISVEDVKKKQASGSHRRPHKAIQHQQVATAPAGFLPQPGAPGGAVLPAAAQPIPGLPSMPGMPAMPGFPAAAPVAAAPVVNGAPPAMPSIPGLPGLPPLPGARA